MSILIDKAHCMPVNAMVIKDHENDDDERTNDKVERRPKVTSGETSAKVNRRGSETSSSSPRTSSSFN